MATLQQLKELFTVVQDLQTSRYIFLIAYTAVIYDIVITVQQERSLFWKEKWTKGKILYYLTRYPFVVEGAMFVVYDISTTAGSRFCEAGIITSSWGTIVFLIPLQIVVILRTVALWEQNKYIKALLLAAFLAADVTIIVTIAKVTKQLRQFSANPLLQPVLGCNSGLMMLSPMITVPAWVAMISFDSVIFLLTMIQSLRKFRSLRTPLLTVLVRDGFWYYAIMLVLALSNLVILRSLSTSHSVLALSVTPLLPASFSIIGSRLLLNMRGVAFSSGSGAGVSTTGDVRLVSLGNNTIGSGGGANWSPRGADPFSSRGQQSEDLDMSMDMSMSAFSSDYGVRKTQLSSAVSEVYP